MSLTQEQIEKLLKNLSKVGIKNKEALTKNMNAILGYMKILEEVDTTGVKPTVSVVQKENILREDIEREKEVNPTDLLNCSNQKVVGNQITVANIMK